MQYSKVVLVLGILSFSPVWLTAKYITLIADYDTPSETIVLGAGEVLTYYSAVNTYTETKWVIYPGGETIRPGSFGEDDKMVGPFSFYITVPPYDHLTDHIAIITFRVDSNEGSGSPRITSDAVVIPADASGEFSVKLESSVDLITWNAAVPGDYSGTTEERFFRVRAIRK